MARFWSASVMVLALYAAPTYAQSTAASAPTAPGPVSANEDSDEIVVTAQKREQRLKDVAAAVAVVSGDALERSGITSPSDLTQLVPSLSFTSGTSEDSSSLRIRGLGTQVFSIGVEPSISYVVDGVVLSREVQGLGDLFDIERIEVLRGPQSTLFGKNASAGVINIITKAPSDEFSVEAFGLVTDDSEYQLKAGVSGPLGDKAGFRLSGFFNDRRGHIRNVANGKRYSGAENYGGRGKFVFKPTEQLTLTAIADYRKSDTTCCQFTARRIVNPATQQFIAPVVPSPSNKLTNVNAATFGGGEQYGASIQADYELDGATLTSITAYRYYDFASDQDIDATPRTAVPVGQNAGYVLLDRNFGRSEAKTWTQELRIASQGSNRIDYVGGLFFFDSELTRDFDRLAQACLLGANATRPIGSPCGAGARNLPAGFNADVSSRSAAAFGEVTWNVLGPVSLITGLRLNYEELSYDFSVFNTAAAATPVTIKYTGAKKVDDTVLIGRGGVKLALSDDANLFAMYSRGYKGYAFDLTTSFTPTIAARQPIAPEKSDAYELSFKGSLLDRRLNLNVTAFRTDYSNFQVQAFDTQAAAFRLLNAGEVRSQGVEIEALIRPISRLSVSAGLTYARTRVREFVGGPCYAGQPVVQTAAGQGAPLTCASNGTAATGDDTQNLKGGRLPNAPDYRVSVNLRYDVPLETMPFDAFVQTGIVTQSDALFALNQNPGTTQDGYSIVNASIGIRDENDRYELTLFARNLFDQNFANSIFEAPVNNSPAGNFFQIIPRDADRYFGASLKLSF